MYATKQLTYFSLQRTKTKLRVVATIITVLSSARGYPSSSHQVRLSNVSPVSLQIVSFRRVSRWWYAVSIRPSRILLTCAAQVHFRLQTCSVTSVLLPRCLIFCPGMWCLIYSFLSLYWVSMFLRHMSLLEVRMSCRLRLFKHVVM